jgi:hypothetical protein
VEAVPLVQQRTLRPFEDDRTGKVEERAKVRAVHEMDPAGQVGVDGDAALDQVRIGEDPPLAGHGVRLGEGGEQQVMELLQLQVADDTELLAQG